MKLRLSDLTAPERIAIDALVPPPRFDQTTFATYEPQHPTQEHAQSALQSFAADVGRGRSRLRFWRRGPDERGRYLDGGFGVGKTHLLAATYHAADVPRKRYVSFQELVYLIGVLGMRTAQERFADVRLLCIDEFELDDPGNTLIVKSFLAPYFAGGGFAVTTSNTPPDAQGQGRFNADDFQREIQSIAERFEVIAVAGPDYRERVTRGTLLDAAELRTAWERVPRNVRTVLATFDELQEFLASVHPVRYRGMLEQIDAVYIDGLRTIRDQGEALRFVHFIDKLYDLEVGFVAAGEIELGALFDASFRHGAYQKKYDRCLSRLGELLVAETETETDADAAPGAGTGAGAGAGASRPA